MLLALLYIVFGNISSPQGFDTQAKNIVILFYASTKDFCRFFKPTAQ